MHKGDHRRLRPASKNHRHKDRDRTRLAALIADNGFGTDIIAFLQLTGRLGIRLHPSDREKASGTETIFHLLQERQKVGPCFEHLRRNLAAEVRLDRHRPLGLERVDRLDGFLRECTEPFGRPVAAQITAPQNTGENRRQNHKRHETNEGMPPKQNASVVDAAALEQAIGRPKPKSGYRGEINQRREGDRSAAERLERRLNIGGPKKIDDLWGKGERVGPMQNDQGNIQQNPGQIGDRQLVSEERRQHPEGYHRHPEKKVPDAGSQKQSRIGLAEERQNQPGGQRREGQRRGVDSDRGGEFPQNDSPAGQR